MAIANAHFIDVNGRRLHYREWEVKKSPLIVLVHGYLGHSHVWDKFAQAMSTNCRVIAVDLCGHGESDWTDRYSISSWADDLRSMAVALALPAFTMLGHSLGATIGFRFAEVHPTMLDHLVAVDGLPQGAWEPTTPYADLPAWFASLDECISYFRQNFTRASEEAIRESISFALRADDKGGFIWRHDLAVREAILRELHLDERWGAAASRTHARITYLRCGRTFVGSHEDTAAVLRHFPNCDLIDMPGVGHAVTRRPDILISVVTKLMFS